MSIKQILIQPVVSEKSFTLSDNAVYTFRVAMDANKKDVKKAVEERFGVSVTKVNMLRKTGKRVFDWRKGVAGRRKDYKKAIVRLKKGDTIDIFK